MKRPGIPITPKKTIRKSVGYWVEEIKKAGTHKYVKREGSPGNYKYYYRLPDGSLGSKEELEAAKKGKAPQAAGGKPPAQSSAPSSKGTKEQAAEPKQDAVAGGNGGNGHGGGDDSGANQYAGSIAVGDTITGADAYTGNAITGKVQAKGRDGITVVDDKNIPHHISWNGIQEVDRVVSDQDAIRMLYDKSSVKGGWRNGDDGYQPESCDSIEGLLKAAAGAREDFNAFSASYEKKFAELSPILIKRSVLKGIDRIREKLQADEVEAASMGKEGTIYDKTTDTYHARTIRDTDGHTFTVNSVADVGKMLAAMNEDTKVIRIKNNFAKPSNLGYSDINMNVRLPNGTIAEIQLNTTANLVAKERYGHSLYEVWRTINASEKGDKHGELKNIMEEAQKALYSLSNRDSKDGTYKMSDTVSEAILNGDSAAIFKEEHKEYADVIKPFVRKAAPLLSKAIKDGLFPVEKDGKENKVIGHFKGLIERLNSV